MSQYSTQLMTAAQLITDAARASLLKKAVLSKHSAPDRPEFLKIPWISHTFSLLPGCGEDRAT